MRTGFAQVPNCILRDSLMTAAEVRLYALLLSYAWRDGECFPGQDRLATDMGLSRVSVNQNIKKLQSKHLIRIRRQGQGKPNIYTIRRLTDRYLPEQAFDKGNTF